MSPRKTRKRRSRKSTSTSTSTSTSKKPVRLILGLAVVAVIIVVVGMYYMSGSGENGSGPVTVALGTTMGDIVLELRGDMPITTGNFRDLVEQGVYDGTIFHRVVDGFMIQGGDPTGTGFGDPSIPAIPDEYTDSNENNRGTIAMANKGSPNTGSSQFFINLDNNNYLDSLHPVFGKVVEGMDVVDQIGKVLTDADDRPLQEARIITAHLVD
jgi:peptidylprolyl isomerase